MNIFENLQIDIFAIILFKRFVNEAAQTVSDEK